MTSLVLPVAVDIREVGPRDGLQIEAPMAWEHKKEMLTALAATGARRIEATSFVSPRAVPSMADAEQVAEFVAGFPDVHWSSLVASVNGAKRSIAAGLPNLEYVISASDAHSRANVGRGTDDSIDLVDQIAALAHEAGGALEVIVATAWDCPFAGPTPPADTVRVLREAVRRGADALALGDTIGTTTPLRVLELIEDTREMLEQLDRPHTDLGVHFHDTRGTGIANALAAVQAGVTSLDASVGGLGGCPFAPGASGNIATEELVYMLEGSGVETGIDLDAVVAAAAVVERGVGHGLPSSLYRAGGRPRPRGVEAAGA